MGLNDLQCACKGNWGRDVSYAITTSLTTENRRAWEQDLLRLYLESLAAAGGRKVRFDDAWTIYRQQTFSALAWVDWNSRTTTGRADYAATGEFD